MTANEAMFVMFGPLYILMGIVCIAMLTAMFIDIYKNHKNKKEQKAKAHEEKNEFEIEIILKDQ